MKKIILSVCIVLSLCGCSDEQSSLSPVSDIVESSVFPVYYKSLCVVYDYARAFMGDSVSSDYPSVEYMLAYIRIADLTDDSGDYIPEIPEYDDIRDILWPNGYGN